VIEFFAVGQRCCSSAKKTAPDKIADPIMVLSVND
jgi:hypothetical protein